MTTVEECSTCGVPFALCEALSDAYLEFLHQEGAQDRPHDFAEWLLQQIAAAGYELVKS